ncbi:MAG TPA: 4Fe-4S dicluster domain-containing protein [Thermoguttaceae bacterium]|nr:4Fe-4S dicluster domain-containing protein [Thermoguttaceae bacterium]
MVRIRRRHALRRPLRTLVRCCALAAAVVATLGLLPWPEAVLVVPGASPFVATAATIATRSVGVAALIAAPVLVVVLVRRRWFCRWLCPVGLMAECAGRLSPVSASRCRRVPPIGKAVVLLSLAGACFGFPFLLWLDPLVLFSAAFGLAHDPLPSAGRIAAGALAGLLVLSFALPGVWCRRLCPLGATQELAAMPGRVFSRRRMASAQQGDGDERNRPWLPRRSVLAMALGAVCAGVGARFGLVGRAQGQERLSSVLRPPGAAPPWQFPQLCLRCGNCVRACPAGIIRAARQSETIGDWLTPVVSIENDYCREDCCACTQVCPSGAIIPGNAAAKHQRPIGLAHVDLNRCRLTQNLDCHERCVKECPYEAITMREWSWEDGLIYPIVHAQKCPGCGACVLACSPMDAIRVLPPGVSPSAVVDSRTREGEQEAPETEDGGGDPFDDWMPDDAGTQG